MFEDEYEEITPEKLAEERKQLMTEASNEGEKPSEEPKKEEEKKPEVEAQAETKEEVSESEQQSATPQGQVDEQVVNETPADPELPEKFKGKKAHEIAQSALEAERRMHEVASERAALRRQFEETQLRLQQLEAQSQQQKKSDPLEEIEQVWEQDPKEALKRVYKKVQEENQTAAQRQVLELRAREAENFYQRTKAENPDFVEREKDMMEFAMKFREIVRPEFANTKEWLEGLYLMSRGARVDEYAKAAIQKSTKQQQLIKEEKRKAASESSVSKGDVPQFSEEEDFANLSPAKQREELKRMKQALGK